MPLITTLNRNFLTNGSFSLVISELPNVSYFSSNITLPGLSSDVTNLSFGDHNYNEIGDRISYDDFSINFNVDENMNNYISLYEWMIDNTKGIKKRDGVLSVLNSNKNNIREITFEDMFPTNIQSIDFDAKITESENVTMEATFSYTKFTISDILTNTP